MSLPISDRDEADLMFFQNTQLKDKIARLESANAELVAALEISQKTIQALISAEAIEQTTVINAYAMCVDADTKARAALAKHKGEGQ